MNPGIGALTGSVKILRGGMWLECSCGGCTPGVDGALACGPVDHLGPAHPGTLEESVRQWWRTNHRQALSGSSEVELHQSPRTLHRPAPVYMLGAHPLSSDVT